MMPPSVSTPSTSRRSSSIAAQRCARSSSAMGSGNLTQGFHIHGRKLADAVPAEDFQRIEDPASLRHGEGVRGHHLGNGPIEGGIPALFKEPGEVAVRK